METKLYIGNLSFDVTEEQLRELFSQVGTIKEIALPMERGSNRPRGFGFVVMSTPTEAQKAIDMLNEHELNGRRIVVNLARAKEDRGAARGG